MYQRIRRTATDGGVRLTPLSTLFQLYRGSQFIGRGNLEYPLKTTYRYLTRVIDKLYRHDRD
jgi:hypothetical protein